VQNALFSLPSFESEDLWSTHLSPDLQMCPAIIDRLIQSKIKSPKWGDRCLISTLFQAVDATVAVLGHRSPQQSTVALTQAAAVTLPVRHVIRYLSPRLRLEERIDEGELLGIGLVAMAALGDVKAVLQTLHNSVCRMRRTRFFGHPITAAARAGQPEVLASLLGVHDSACDEGAKLEFQCRLGERSCGCC